MAEKMTRIRLRHSRYGQMEWGEQSFEEMTRKIRERAERMMEEARAILEAENDSFEVDIVRGPLAQHFVRHVEPTPSPARSAS